MKFKHTLISVAQAPPNIIVVLVDDAGYADWGFNGSDEVQTPNIDNLVSRGTYFSEGYVSNSVCSPSRAGLITGRYQNRFGYEFNLVTPVIAPGYTETDLGLDVKEDDRRLPQAPGVFYFYHWEMASR